jgi:DNA ligase-1
MAPRWFTDRMPDAPLDGELWMGRGRFDALASCVRRSVPVPAEWRDVRFMVFELPDAPGPFAERARQIEQRVAQARWATLGAVTQRPVADREALRRELAATLARGGEGLMLHRSDAPYQAGRSEFLRKLKPTLDAEAQVVAHLPGQGRLSGLLGALALRTPQGVEFRVGTGLSDATRRNPPALGSRVTYRYRDLTPAGVPRFASYLRAHAEL